MMAPVSLKYVLNSSIHKFLVSVFNSIVYELLQINLQPHINVVSTVKYVGQSFGFLAPSTCTDLVCEVCEPCRLSPSSNEVSACPRKIDYTQLIRTISSISLPEKCANAATYRGYSALCKRLFIYIPSPGSLQCATCGCDKCNCIKFKFTYIQYLECTCIYGQFGLCTCDEIPEFFADLDELKRYQLSLIDLLLGIEPEILTQKSLLLSEMFMPQKSETISLRVAASLQGLRWLSGFEPP